MPSYNKEYNRQKAVEYAHRWAYGRNRRYLDFSNIGGDCTNFCSQCIYAGAKAMNNKPVYGWYYTSPGKRAPAWSGVEFLYNFLVGNTGEGPVARETEVYEILPGDIIQLMISEERFHHTLFVVDVMGRTARQGNIFIATHSQDSDNRPLLSYDFKEIRFIHIEGVN